MIDLFHAFLLYSVLEFSVALFLYFCSDMGMRGLPRGGAALRVGRGRGAAGSRAASARLYGARRKSASPAEVRYQFHKVQYSCPICLA